MKKLLIFLFFLTFLSCKPKKYEEKESSNPYFYHQVVQKLSETITYDIFSPPVASRIYFYSALAGYEAMVGGFSDFRSLSGQINQFNPTPLTDFKENCYPLSGVRAYLVVARMLTFSPQLIDELEKNIYKKYEDLLPSDVYKKSMVYGDSVAKHVLRYADKDNYKQTRGTRFTLTKKKSDWVPTPPMYMDAVEPFWRTIRTASLDSAGQFKPTRPQPFSTDKKSPFQKQVQEVLRITSKLDSNQVHIAKFWDCNPFVMNVNGHAMYADKKLSPGGHWLGIAGQLCRQKNKTMIESAEAYLLTAMALYDGFISCWDEKYRSVCIRPETIIQTTNANWKPLLQTPPFPEYTSGHSVISGASATVMEHIFGHEIAFTDSTEVLFKLGTRSFKSISQAAAEASISRVYGGIHFRQAVDEGLKQGNQVGNWILKKIKTRK